MDFRERRVSVPDLDFAMHRRNSVPDPRCASGRRAPAMLAAHGRISLRWRVGQPPLGLGGAIGSMPHFAPKAGQPTPQQLLGSLPLFR
jgi:hypothetical protein